MVEAPGFACKHLLITKEGDHDAFLAEAGAVFAYRVRGSDDHARRVETSYVGVEARVRVVVDGRCWQEPFSCH